MKKVLTTVLLAVMTIGLATAQEKQAEITFEKTSHDFGTIKEADGPVTWTFKFTNTGTANLILYQVVASCGCTTPTYPKEPIKPGESGEIKVTYNGSGRNPGKFYKYLTIRANTKEEIIRLTITGTMIGK